MTQYQNELEKEKINHEKKYNYRNVRLDKNKMQSYRLHKGFFLIICIKDIFCGHYILCANGGTVGRQTIYYTCDITN